MCLLGYFSRCACISLKKVIFEFHFVCCREHSVVGGVLTIPSVKAEDLGEYICTARNQFGTTQSIIVLKSGGMCIIISLKKRNNTPSILYILCHLPL